MDGADLGSCPFIIALVLRFLFTFMLSVRSLCNGFVDQRRPALCYFTSYINSLFIAAFFLFLYTSCWTDCLSHCPIAYLVTTNCSSTQTSPFRPSPPNRSIYRSLITSHVWPRCSYSTTFYLVWKIAFNVSLAARAVLEWLSIFSEKSKI